MDYEIKIFSKLNSELRECWQTLERESCSYCFQSYEWFENWVNNYRTGNKNYSLCVVCCHPLLPLQRHARKQLLKLVSELPPVKTSEDDVDKSEKEIV